MLPSAQLQLRNCPPPPNIAAMDAQTEIYPYELFVLLEALMRERFTGTASIYADGGRTVLYVSKGSVRYARTTRVMSTFPAYLLTERILPKRRVKDSLRRCTELGMSLEQFLISNDALTNDDLRHLKRDLARSIFGRSFTLSGSVELKPATRRTPEFRQPPLDPFAALFRCISEHPDRRAMSRALEAYDDQRMRRGPDFFAQMPLFRQYFGRTQLIYLMESNPTIDEVREAMGQKGATISEIFAAHLSGMIFFESEEASRSPLRNIRSGAPLRSDADKKRGGHTNDNNDDQGGYDDPDIGVGERPERTIDEGSRRFDELTEPGVGSYDVAVVAGSFAAGAKEMTNPGPAAEASDRSLNLRDILVGESLIGAADQAERQDYYRFFGMGPMAPFSQLRAAYLAAWSQYGGARFEEYQLSTEALSALERLQAHIEDGYETLTDRGRRGGHNHAFSLDADVLPAELDALFRAEDLFKDAQIKLTDGDNGAALTLLAEATRLNPMEPEYVAYLAWAITCASMWGQAVDPETPPPDKLLKRALRMDPRLESAWIFRARVAELSGDIKTSLSCFVYALKANPDNEEAEQAVERLRAAGVELDPPKKASLQDRLGGLLGHDDEISQVGPLPQRDGEASAEQGPSVGDEDGDVDGDGGANAESKASSEGPSVDDPAPTSAPV